jgi:hypothetical protein
VTVDQHLARVSAMSAVERKTEWRRLYGTPAPPGLGSSLLARAIAYRLQEKQHGGLTKGELRRLAQLGRKDERGRAGKTAPVIKPGTWLSRTWHGEVHQVIVLESGFDYRGERYQSLTAIAKQITGANWSGPRFFGLYSSRLGKLAVTPGG